MYLESENMSELKFPNFERIHSFLEERFGTSTILMRYAVVDANLLTIIFNEDSQKNDKSFWISTLTDIEKKYLSYISQDGPAFTEDFMNLRVSETNEWMIPYIYAQRKLMGTDRQFGWSFSGEFAKRVVSRNFPTECLENVDLIMAHEAMHAAINRVEHILRLQYGSAHSLYSEALAMNETIEFQNRFGSENRWYDNFIFEQSCKVDTNNLPHSKAARLVRGGHPEIEKARQLIYRENMKM